MITFKKNDDSSKTHSLNPQSPLNKNEYKKPEITQIDIKDSFLSNCFLKLSEFANILGIKVMMEVDWDYLTSRNWETTHSYLKEEIYEAVLAFGLSNEFVSGTVPLNISL